MTQRFRASKGLPCRRVPRIRRTFFTNTRCRVLDGRRDQFRDHLASLGVPAMIYYPVPLQQQNAFRHFVPAGLALPNADQLSAEVISLPIHTEMDAATLDTIINAVKSFFRA